MAQVEAVEGERDEASEGEKQQRGRRSKGARTGVDSAGIQGARRAGYVPTVLTRAIVT